MSPDPILVVAMQVAGVESDYRALTERCGLLDRSERGKLALSGRDAASFLQGQVTNDVERLVEGEGCYAAFLTPKGKMLGDLRVLCTVDELLLDTERVALQGLFNMIRRFSIGYDAELHKRTLERGLLTLIGPDVDRIVGTDQLPATEHSHRPIMIDGIEARAIRTDSGIDLLCLAAETENLRSDLAARGAVHVSEEAAECVRIEGGRPLYGVDLDETVIPQEAGLNERAVSFTKGCYVGQETVARLHYRGKPNRHLRGLRLSAPYPPGSELLLGDRMVGRLTSVVESPRFGPIGLALVRREAAPGVTLVPKGEDGTAEVVALPFIPTA
ncbi:MAG TPA: glycine cleavage T C-terminal barrel domain-containing protein [Solirubrobacteraceae bacterium]|nr:glycine cleavage T C-terminal barrel domain-containing protein [Solirubrobacteraceae bacterium]